MHFLLSDLFTDSTLSTIISVLDRVGKMSVAGVAYVPVKSKLQHPPPGQSPGHLIFWKIFVQIPPSPGRKAVQMPPLPGKLPDYCFNFSVASIMLLKLCM